MLHVIVFQICFTIISLKTSIANYTASHHKSFFNKSTIYKSHLIFPEIESGISHSLNYHDHFHTGHWFVEEICTRNWKMYLSKVRPEYSFISN